MCFPTPKLAVGTPTPTLHRKGLLRTEEGNHYISSQATLENQLLILMTRPPECQLNILGGGELYLT